MQSAVRRAERKAKSRGEKSQALPELPLPRLTRREIPARVFVDPPTRIGAAGVDDRAQDVGSNRTLAPPGAIDRSDVWRAAKGCEGSERNR